MTFAALMFEIVLADMKAIGYRCTQADCDQIAVATVHWPSGDTRCCDMHVAGWFRIAEAMGLLNLKTTPLPVRRFDVAPDDPATIRASLLELDERTTRC
jgi:hypothetical protein